MNWDDPADRLRLIQAVGHEAYNRKLREHLEKDVVSKVNGHGIRPVMTRFGLLYAVNGTDKAFATQEAAEQYANGLARGVTC